MAQCHQATNHCLRQCWPRSMSPCGFTKPQWVNTLTSRRYSWVNISRVLQNILLKFVYCRNSTCDENFKLKLRTCAQSHALGTRTKFQLKILIINVMSGVVYFREIILESLRNVSKTTPWFLNKLWFSSSVFYLKLPWEEVLKLSYVATWKWKLLHRECVKGWVKKINFYSNYTTQWN